MPTQLLQSTITTVKVLLELLEEEMLEQYRLKNQPHHPRYPIV
jgi:hypothetical protein